MRLFYRRYGQGQTIIALHGLYASSDSWMGLVHDLSRTYQIILVDLRNHGRSPHSPDHSYSAISSDLLELYEELSIEKAILMGHSMGGKAAMHFALRHPERVKGLIIEDISPLAYPMEHENVSYHKKIIDALLSLTLVNYVTRQEVENVLSASIPDKILCRFLLKNLHRDKEGKLEWRINLQVLRNNLSQIMENVIDDKNKVVTIPSLFFKGDLSKYISKEDENAISMIFSQSEILTVEGISHWIHNEQQTAFLKNVNQYLSLLNSAD